jgi:osmotically-inducible protein OsmY
MEAGMFKTFFRLILVVVVLVAIGAFFVGYRWARPTPYDVIERPTGTTGSTAEIDQPRATAGIDESRARQAGAEVGEKVAIGVNDAQRALANGAVTAKIKSKMALDDAIEAWRINVDTNGSVVTLSGNVRSSSEHARALQLARETEGVTSVVDRIAVQSR